MNGSGTSRLARRGAALSLMAVAVYYAVWGGEYSAFDLRRLDQRKNALTLQLAETERQVDSLKSYAELLDRDPATIEAVARERFGMIRDGEILYRFVPLPEPPAANPGGVRAATATRATAASRTPTP